MSSRKSSVKNIFFFLIFEYFYNPKNDISKNEGKAVIYF